MSPSSLVFAAIVGVWAVYLVPHWLRRRHELAQAREQAEADDEAAGTRVLAPRRRSRQAAPASRPTLHRRPASGERAQAAAESVVAEPVVAEPVARKPVVAEPVARKPVVGKPAGPKPVRAEPPSTGGLRLPRTVQEVAARAAARRRARVLVALVLATTLGWVLVAVDVLEPLLGVPVTALLILDLIALRMSAKARQAAAVARAASAKAVDRLARAEAADMAPAPEPELFDVDPPVERVVAAASGEGWTPVPVPPPVYTLKPAAPRTDLAPRERPVAPAEPVPAVAEHDLAPLDLDAVLERRRAVNG